MNCFSLTVSRKTVKVKVMQHYTLVKNAYTKMYLEYIYLMLSILQIHLAYIFRYLIKIPCNCYFGILNWYS